MVILSVTAEGFAELAPTPITGLGRVVVVGGPPRSREALALAVELGLGLLLLENALAAMVLDGELVTFTRLDAAGQDATLQRWQDSPMQLRRTIYKALNGLCTATYWSSPEIWRLVGYPGPGAHLGVKELP